jgi:hypothetical protein
VCGPLPLPLPHPALTLPPLSLPLPLPPLLMTCALFGLFYWYACCPEA